MVSFPSGAACYSLFSPLPIHLLCITSQSDFPKSLVSDLICLTLLLESALPQPLPSTAFQLPMGRSVLGEAEEQRGSKGPAGWTDRTGWRTHGDKGFLAGGEPISAEEADREGPIQGGLRLTSLYRSR